MQSLIDPSKIYEENYTLEKKDKGFKSPAYRVQIKKKHYLGVLGMKREDAKIVHFPIYLMSPNNKVEKKVGVYEIRADQDYLDEDKDVDLDKLGKPLIFAEVNNAFLEKYGVPVDEDGEPEDKEDDEEDEDDKDEDDEKDKDEDNKDEDDKDEEDNKDEDNKDEDNKDEDDEKDEKEDDEKDEKEDDEKNDNDNDIEEMFILPEGTKEKKTSKLSITDVLTKGTADRTVYPPETMEEAKEWVKEYRQKKAKDDNWIQQKMQNKEYQIHPNEGDGDCFFACIRDAYLSMGYQTDITKLRTFLSQEATFCMLEQYQSLYRDAKREEALMETEIKETQQSLLSLRKKMSKVTSKQLNSEGLEEAKRLEKKLMFERDSKQFTQEQIGEFRFVQHIDTIEQFRERLRTSDYWADTWAISTLERLLNIKVIVLENVEDDEAVLRCGQLNETDNVYMNYDPEFYLIVGKTGEHYQLVSYRKNKIFTFPQIPYALKRKIVDKCLQRNAGPYWIIPAVKQFQIDMGIDLTIPTADPDNLDLYDPETVIMFHVESAVHKAGEGSGERITREKKKEFLRLNTIDSWRKKLSDQYVKTPFELDHKRWTSVYHYLTAVPFEKEHPEIYDAFSLSKKDDVSKTVEGAKQSILKKGKFYTEFVHLPDLAEEDYEHYRAMALKQRFTQNADLTTLLKETKNAKLTMFRRARPALEDTLLMKLRKEIRDL